MLHFYALLLVLLAAVLHALWNALLKGGRNQSQFMNQMALVMGMVALLVIPFCRSPGASCWAYIAASSILHLCYNVFLLKSY